MESACLLQDAAAIADAVDMSERQPLFMKDKGDALFKAGNWQAAVNAYTRALQLDSTMLACYSNRAAANLKQGNHRCDGDTRVSAILNNVLG